MEPSFEIFDHTADAGIRVRAATLPELIEPAARGLYAVIGELVAGGEPQHATVQRADGDAATLLRDYLAEVLLLFECGHRMVTAVRVEVFDDRELRAAIETRLVDTERSVYYREVKAITYHELEIRTIPGGYEATLIVDI